MKKQLFLGLTIWAFLIYNPIQSSVLKSVQAQESDDFESHAKRTKQELQLCTNRSLTCQNRVQKLRSAALGKLTTAQKEKVCKQSLTLKTDTKDQRDSLFAFYRTFASRRGLSLEEHAEARKLVANATKLSLSKQKLFNGTLHSDFNPPVQDKKSTSISLYALCNNTVPINLADTYPKAITLAIKSHWGTQIECVAGTKFPPDLQELEVNAQENGSIIINSEFPPTLTTLIINCKTRGSVILATRIPEKIFALTSGDGTGRIVYNTQPQIDG